MMRKIVVASLVSLGLFGGGYGNHVEVSAANEKAISNNDSISIQAATAAYLTPKNLDGRTNTSYSLKVSTNVGGDVYFYFKSGISGEPYRSEPGSGSRNFSQRWVTKSISTFTTSAYVVSPEYGPSPVVNGKAVIVY